ncbi:MAG TPA: ECF subfamily RNA polymerase sigma factor, BldN family [Frankiaceae bacterium]|nr:ECF subfamily RNA polymerase sigma factor, BldN family [Frankiaceae bacterium]
MSRPTRGLGGLDELRAELLRYHTEPNAYPDVPGIRASAGSFGNVVPLRPDVTLPLVPGADAAPGGPGEPAEVVDEVIAEPDARAEVVALVARAQQGDAEAFGELYDRYLDLIYRYVYYRVGGKALTEDLVSETFLRALRRIGTFEWQGRDFAAWLVTIARNIIADHYKSSRFRLEVSTADMLDADRADEGIEAGVLENITNAALLDAVKKLNGEQQECVVLRFLQGLSVLETAQAMGKSEGAIKALQYRAVRTLGRMLPKELVL